ncbi:hypothetical protein CL617_03455 [archaeon]|nr:hypothetical protein [archaeon]|tara:strand:+ start:10149 stop:11654 length:1506 start_codon:yes stop_codon:yes gene_type:complete
MKKVDTSSKELLTGASIVMGGLFVSKLIGYIYTILIAKIGSETFGLYSLGISIISFLVIISLFGFKSGIVRYISYYNTKKNDQKVKGIIKSTLKISIPISIFFSFLLFFFSSFIANNIFHNSDLSFLLKLFAFTIPLLVITEIFFSVFTAFKKIKYKVITNDFIEKISKLFLAFLLIYLGFKLESAIYSFVFSTVISFIFVIYFMNKSFPLFNNKLKSLEIKKELIYYSFPLLFSGVLSSVVKWIDTIMIGIFLNASEVGIYNVALSTSSLMILVPTAIMALFLPLITEKYSKNDDKQIKKIYDRTVRWIFMFNISLFIFIAIFSREILNTMFGQEYVIGSTSLLILIFGYFIFSFIHIHTGYLILIKKTRLILLVNFIMALTNVILNLYLIPKYGIVGGAIATSVSLIIAYLLSFFFSYKFSRINPYNVKISKILLFSFIIFIVISIFIKIKKFLSPITLTKIIFLGIIFLLVYGIILYFMLNKEDKLLFKELVLKKFKN